MTIPESAIAKFEAGYNCAQAVLWAFRDEAGLSEDFALRISTALGGGMARKQEVCGAVAAGALVISLRHGRGSAEGRSATEETYRKTRDMMDRFALRRGSCICRELLKGYDLQTEEGRTRAKQDDVHGRICKACVQTVAEILEEIK